MNLQTTLLVALVLVMLTATQPRQGIVEMTQTQPFGSPPEDAAAATAPQVVEVKPPDLQQEKLRLEIAKLKYDTRSEWRRPGTWLGGLSTLAAVIAIIAGGFYSSAKYELAKADARNAQADAREAESRHREAEQKLTAVRSELEVSEKKLSAQREESAQLGDRIAQASKQLAGMASGPSSKFDINSPEIAALLRLGNVVVVNESDDPVEIGFNTASGLTGFGLAHWSPEAVKAYPLPSDDLKFLPPIPPHSSYVAPELARGHFRGNTNYTYFQLRARPQGRPNDVTPVVDPAYLRGCVVKYNGTSLEVISPS